MQSFKLDTNTLSTWNGIGLTLYGKSDIGPDSSYTTTKWFVFIFLPLIPLGSYRVLSGETEVTALGSRTNYQMVKVSLNKKQTIKTYIIGWSIAAIIITIIRVIIGPSP